MRVSVADMTAWGGVVQVSGPDGVAVDGATVDSRDAGRGQLFVGIPGENVDGGMHAPEAIARGAAAVMISPQAWAQVGPDLAVHDAVVVVAPDPVAALGRIGHGALMRLGARVVGVTGSYGKTSTKDCVLAVLRAAGVRAEGTPGNRNTEVGVPLSILGLPDDTDVAVVEMGMRGPGQLALLSGLAPPDVACITAVGPVHLEILGTIEAVAAAKAEILVALRPGGAAVVPHDAGPLEPHVAALPQGVEVVRFGDDPAIDLDLGDLKAWERRNVAAAVAVAQALGLAPVPGTPVRLERSAMRGTEHPLPGGGVLVEDCYNANPPAMEAALADLCRRPGRKVAVLADMLELGPDEDRYHRQVGEHAAMCGVDLLIAVGARAASYPRGATAVESVAFPSTDDAVAGVPALIRPGDAVLVKGSRGMAMERVAEAVLEGTR